ncbi:sensor histidine kinase [uncultured Oscillibacter sp.]|uniref:sensor histidine kinase n=1 Tax=uncultured Oscillibacter sp. TaxID=876091 RepID=UPI0025CE7998|nr:sensor histidine kinase [uncultured Oscillibacter sp.]
MTVLRDISFLWSMLHVVAMFLIFFEPRCSWRTALLAGFAGTGSLLSINVLAMFRWGSGIIMSIAFLTCTVPSALLFFLLSKYRDGRFFFLFCLTDTLCFWLLQVTNLLDRLTGDTYVVLLLSRLILFPAAEYLIWRYLRRPYRELQSKLDRGWWLFAGIGVTYYLLIMVTAVPVDAPLPDGAGLLRMSLVMLLMPLTYMAILHSLWRQMQMYEDHRLMELQRQDYESLCQKMEVGRIYRHDMRHHLAAMEGMLQQGDDSGALQYLRSLSGGLEKLTEPARCANAAVNAVLTAYIVQADNEGCTVETELRVPEKLPFEETDLCVILANALENAIHACRELPRDQRRIDLGMELTENRRLVISMGNPCPRPVAFGPDGLPDVPKRDGHGLGLKSVKRVVERYGGLFRCQWEQERFLFRAVLMPPDDPAVRKDRRRPSWKTAAAAVLLLILGAALAMADTPEEIPLLSLLEQAIRAAGLSLPPS